MGNDILFKKSRCSKGIFQNVVIKSSSFENPIAMKTTALPLTREKRRRQR